MRLSLRFVVPALSALSLLMWGCGDSTDSSNPNRSVYVSPSTQEKNVGVDHYGTEEMRMNQIAQVVERELQSANLVTYRNNPDMTVGMVVSDSNGKRPDIHVAIHSNAGGGRGCEIFAYRPGTQSDRLARAIYAQLEPLTPSKDRGIKYAPKWDEVWRTNATAVLLEVGFHDNQDDALFIINNIEPIGKAIARGILLYFRG